MAIVGHIGVHPMFWALQKRCDINPLGAATLGISWNRLGSYKPPPFPALLEALGAVTDAIAVLAVATTNVTGVFVSWGWKIQVESTGSSLMRNEDLV